MYKKIFFLGITIFMMLSLAGCNGDSGKKPKDLDDTMPEIWEEGYSIQVEGSGDIISTDLKGVRELTISVDQGYKYVKTWMNTEDLENIYVEEGHSTLVSEDGVLYSKSFETLIRWPAKKPVTMPKDSIKYFASECYYQCINMPEDFQLPDGAISIGSAAFYDSNLTKIHIKQNIKTVGDAALQSETLKTIEISSPIVYRYFFSNQYVETVIFNEGVKQIRGNGKLTRFRHTLLYLSRVEFPSTLEAIGDVHFPVNVSVKKYVLKENISYLSDYAFHDYIGKGTEITIVDSIGPPLNRYRKCKTEFGYSSECAETYLNKKMDDWKKNWNSLIETLREALSDYKKYETQGNDSYIDQRIAVEEYLEELLKL